MGWGVHEFYNHFFSSHIHVAATYQLNLVKTGSVVLEKKILTKNAGELKIYYRSLSHINMQ